jgi:hypothetical protein
MPIYVYEHPKTEEVIELIQGMNDEHVYVDKEGVEWKRIFLSSQLNTESSIDHWSSNDFVEKTKDAKGSYGDMLDRSAELSEKRSKDYGGIDPVKQKYFENYSKNRGGSKHLQDPSRKKAGNGIVDIQY